MNVDPSAATPPLAAPLRSRILDVRRWALAAGRPLDAGVLGLILAAKTWHADEPLDRWSRIGVYQTLYSGVWNWCTVHSVPFPHDLPGVLWRYLSYLEETRQFEDGSDPVRELRRPLRCYGGLGADGLPAPATHRESSASARFRTAGVGPQTESQADPRLAVPAVVPAPRDDIVPSLATVTCDGALQRPVTQARSGHSGNRQQEAQGHQDRG